jgi:putative nucleotidyltransferase with HDIG domain
MNTSNTSNGDPGAWERFRQTQYAYHGARWLPLVALALVTYLLFPVVGSFTVFVPDVGEVSTEGVLAPFDFDVLMTEAERQQEAEQLAAQVQPTYQYQDGVSDSVAAHVARVFSSLDSADTARTLLEIAQEADLPLTSQEVTLLENPRMRQAFAGAIGRMVATYLARGVAASGTIEEETHNEVFVVRRDGNEVRMNRDSITTRAQYLELRMQQHPNSNSLIADVLFVKLLNTFFRPSLLPNLAATAEARDLARASVDPLKDHVRANERIISSNEIVTAEARDRLLALQQELVNRGELDTASFLRIVGQVLTNALVVAVFWLLLLLYLPNTYGELRHMYVFSALFAVVILAAAANHRFIHPGAELIPIPFAALVMTVLFNGRIAMVGAMVLAVLLGFQPDYGGPDAFYIALLGGVTAALSVRTISRRTEVLSSTALVVIAFAVAAFTVGLRDGWSAQEFGFSVVRGASNATVSAALVFMALPIFERWAHVTTDLSLLELSDPNRLLLRRLATEVPGTYAHSVAMANLSERACDAIGAGGLLARVGCYYHDIGKLQKPLHFVENQGVGGNPHDRLPPDASATIIRNHVIDGLALAEEHGLPPTLKAFIPEHHGTAEITYFLERARQDGEVPKESLYLYRYPGPKPRSAETAVCMLADGVEAGLRVLDEPTPKKLSAAIQYVVNQRVEAGQLDEAPLTLAQLDKVKDSFVHTLSGMYHNRLDYPEEAGGITADWDGESDT